MRVSPNGDTCVENRGQSAHPQLTDAFGEASYQLKPGQHVLFEHGSLRAVVDRETTPCGCPPDDRRPVPLAEASCTATARRQRRSRPPPPTPSRPRRAKACAPPPPLPADKPGVTHSRSPPPSPSTPNPRRRSSGPPAPHPRAPPRLRPPTPAGPFRPSAASSSASSSAKPSPAATHRLHATIDRLTARARPALKHLTAFRGFPCPSPPRRCVPA